MNRCPDCGKEVYLKEGSMDFSLVVADSLTADFL